MVLVGDAALPVGSSWPGDVNVADGRERHIRCSRGALSEGAVWSVRVVMLDVLAKDCLEVTASEDERPVQALALYGADDTLADGVRPGCSDGVVDYPGALGVEDGVEGGGELRVAISDEELDGICLRGELRRDVAGTLSHPRGHRVGRDPGDAAGRCRGV